MRGPFTNAHAHIFTVKHAPDYFLKTAIRSTSMAEFVERLIQKKTTRALLTGVNWISSKLISPNKRGALERYIEFVKIGTAATQKDVFDQIAKNYTHFGNFRIIVLTQVLDYLDLERDSNHIRIETQVEQVAELKRNALYQKNLFPFLGLDPRQLGKDLLNDWIKKYISKDFGFYGIKIYPAAGFFPFDSRLDAIWAWAEENQIPIMTHCTRGGSFYLGRFDSLLTGVLDIQHLDPEHPALTSIFERLKNLTDDTSIHKNNHVWCNIFGHPDNYRLILAKYPKLKLCLAHLGGSNEVNRGKNDEKSYPKYLQDNWYFAVLELMKDFENVYSDISYTLSDKPAMEIIRQKFREQDLVDIKGTPLINKLMYGTDFYMTGQEEFGGESQMQTNFLHDYSQAEIERLAYDNPEAYLTSKIHPVID